MSLLNKWLQLFQKWFEALIVKCVLVMFTTVVLQIVVKIAQTQYWNYEHIPWINQLNLFFCRIEVPYHMSEGYSMTVTVRYKKLVSSTPIWVHIKWNKYPTSTNHDKSGATFVGRKYNRIRQDNPKSGIHYLMIEPLADARITISVSLLPLDHPGAGQSQWRPGLYAQQIPAKRTFDVTPIPANTPKR